ncbi:hypothetical protein B566_EDAN014795 [Ephemera danica]|nr:hypothetical protein B566_EDAN014795 [Ephemera danica]
MIFQIITNVINNINMAESNLTYERRDGTDCDHGIKFEWQTTNLAYLRCEKLHRQWSEDNTSGVKSYFVANNVDGIGAFDDVVIRAVYPERSEEKNKLIFVQSKHFIKPQNNFLDKLLNLATVQIYFDSFIAVLRVLRDHRAISCKTYKEIKILKEAKRHKPQGMERNAEKEQKLRNLLQCKPQDCEFILYSNMIFESGSENIAQIQQDKDISMQILNTSRSNKFNIPLNSEQLEYLPNEQFINEREMFEELKHEFTAKFRIIVNQVDNVNVDLLRSIMPKADIRGMSPLLEEEVKCMFKNKLCTAVSQNLQLLENVENFSKLITIEKNEMESFLRIPEHVRLFSNETIENLQKQFENCSQTKIYTSCMELEKLKLKQFVTNGFLESKLLVFIKDKEDFSIWTKARKSMLYKNLNQIIVCIEDSNKFSGFDKNNNEVFIEINHDSDITHSFCFAKFSDETTKSILNHAVTFQGYTVTVNDLCGDEWRRLLDEETTCRILRAEEIIIGSKFFDPIDCYMERKLKFKELKQPHIDYENNITETKIFTEDEIMALENKKAILLTGSAGIGKSTTLKSLALKYKNKNPTYFVYFIELNKYLNVLKKYKEESDISKAIDFLAKNILGTQKLENRLFVNACAERKNVALFFDAFDEISPDGEKKFSFFLKTLLEAHVSSIFVSSRPNFIGTLENKLNQDSLIFVPFSSDDMKFFFLNYYENLTKKNATRNDQEKMENVIVKSIEDATEEKFDELLTIPLHITMLAEIYFEKYSEMTTDQIISFSLNMDICSLYNAFIEKLVVRYLVEKKDLNMLKMQDAHINIEIRNTMRDAEELSCKLICPDINQTPLAEYGDAIVKMCNLVGIITNIDPPVFLHRTYGEFLAANWFVKCIKNEIQNASSYVSFLCKNVLIDNQYRGTRRFINAIICNLNSGETDSHLINPNVKILFCWEYGENSLHVAVQEKLAEIVKLLVQNDPSHLNDKNLAGFTAPQLACRSGCLKSFGIMVSNSCLNNVKDVDKNQVLHCAAEVNNTDIIQLIGREAPTLLMTKTINGLTAFNFACKYDKTEAAMCLFKHNRSLVDIPDAKGNFPLHYATKNGNIEIVKEILCHNINFIDIKRNDGLFPLHIACKYNHYEVAKFFVTQKNSLVTLGCGEKEETPLHFAVRNCNIELMTLLLQHDETLLNKCNIAGESPLLCALHNNQTAAAKYLLTFPNCSLGTGVNLLNLAAEMGDVDILRKIYSLDPALLNKCNIAGDSPLLSALHKQQTAAAKFLLTCSNCSVGTGENPLNFAAEIGDVDILRKIYSLDPALLNKCNLAGESPLLCALNKQQIAAAKFLLACPNCSVGTGENPLNFAAEIGDVDILRKIYSLDPALLNKCNLAGESPLLCALKKQQTVAAKFLLTCPNCSVGTGENPLNFAVEIGDVDILRKIYSLDPALLNKCNIAGESPLLYALKKQQTAAAKFLLTCPNCSVGTGENPLNFAAEIGDVDILRKIYSLDCTLLNKEVGETCYSGCTPLLCALKKSNFEAANFLLGLPECLLTLDINDKSPFHYAAMNGYIDIIKLLINKDRSLLLKRDKNGKSALSFAIDANQTEIARTLFSNDEYFMVGNSLQKELEIEIRENNFEIMTMMLECNPTLINMRISGKLLPLEIACECNNIEAMRYLLLRTDSSQVLNYKRSKYTLSKWANDIVLINLILENFPTLLNQQDFSGCRVLHYACINGDTKLVKLLLNHIDCQIEVCDDDLENPLHKASRACNIEVMEMILERDNTLLNKQNKRGQTPLHLANYGTKKEDSDELTYAASKYLLSLNCLVNVEDKDGLTPINFASMKNKVKTVKLLLENDGTLLNQQNKEGCTPLHYACDSGRNEMVSFLLNLPECNINLTDNAGNTPLHYLTMHTHLCPTVKSLSLLLQRDRSLLTVKNNNGLTALHFAANYSDVYTIEYLLDHIDSKAIVQDIDGDTPLHLYIRKLKWGDDDDDDYELEQIWKIFFFASHKSSLLNIQNNDGETALHIAVEKGMYEVVELLVEFGADVNIKDNDDLTPIDLALLEVKEIDDENDCTEKIINFLLKTNNDNRNN